MANVDMEFESEAQREDMNINALPDLAMLKIFSNLDFFDLCKCSRVCWRWYHYTKSPEFLKRIVIRNRLRRPGELPSLIEHHCTEFLEEFQLLRYHPSQMLMFTDSDLTTLLQRCTRLKKLVLMYCYLNYFSLSSLPPSVTHVSVRGCHVVPETFFSAPSTIVSLDLGGVRQFLTSAEMPLLNRCTSLRALFLEGCDRINNAGIEAIIDILPQLHVIDVEGTDISNQGAQNILNYCSNAQDVYLGYTSIDDGVFENIDTASLPVFRNFCVKGTKITPEGLERFMVDHCKSHEGDKRSREFYHNCLDCNEAFHKMLRVYLGAISECHHYESHPEYGRRAKSRS